MKTTKFRNLLKKYKIYIVVGTLIIGTLTLLANVFKRKQKEAEEAVVINFYNYTNKIYEWKKANKYQQWAFNFFIQKNHEEIYFYKDRDNKQKNNGLHVQIPPNKLIDQDKVDFLISTENGQMKYNDLNINGPGFEIGFMYEKQNKQYNDQIYKGERNYQDNYMHFSYDEKTTLQNYYDMKDKQGDPVLKVLFSRFIYASFFEQMEPVIQVIMENTDANDLVRLKVENEYTKTETGTNLMEFFVPIHSSSSINDDDIKKFFVDVWIWLLTANLPHKNLEKGEFKEFEEKIKKINKELSFSNRITSYAVPDFTPSK
jgi:hypothetical protein